MHPDANNHSGPLRAALEDAAADNGGSLKDYTVLAAQNDPFRFDTPAGHRDGQWLAMQLARLGDRPTIHLRGLHYATLGQIKPDGKRYTNTDSDWVWLQGKAADAARWLGYVPFERIVDQRNQEPVVRIFEPPNPTPYIHVGEVEVHLPETLTPTVQVEDFRGVQPYKLVLFGEKVSLEPVLAPIAEQRAADLYLPTGEASDSMIHKMASHGAADGRKMIVFYLSDCDPAGWQMAVSVARKLQAFQHLEFPALEFEVRPVALTPDQVREYGLPSTPMKPTERRAGKWHRAMGVEQTEIDSIATLQPDLLDRLVRHAIKPFYDAGLAGRVREAREAWRAEAQTALEAQLGPDELRRIRAEGRDKLAELRDEIEAFNDALRVDTEGIALPGLVIPEAELDRGLYLDAPPPLIDSDDDFALQSELLIAHKAYQGGA